MFKNLNEALVEVLKIDPNSKKARQYSGFSVNGDEITFSTKQGRELTYTAGLFEGDYAISKVKTQGMEKKKIDRTIDGVETSYWEHSYLDAQGGTFHSTDIDGINLITREVAALDETNAKMMLDDVKYVENLTKGEVRRIDEIRKMEGKNREKADNYKKNNGKNLPQSRMPYHKLPAKHYEKNLANHSNTIRSIESSIAVTEKEIDKGIKLAKDANYISRSVLHKQANKLAESLGVDWKGGYLGFPNDKINDIIDDKEVLGYITPEKAKKLKKKAEHIKEHAPRLADIQNKRIETFEKQKQNVAKTEKELVKKSKKNVQNKAKKADELSNKFVKGANIYEEAQKTWGEGLTILREGIGSLGRRNYESIDSGLDTITQQLANDIVEGKKITTKEYNGTVKKTNSNIGEFSAVGSNYKSKIKDIVSVGKTKSYFDFETIGDIGTKNFMATQLSVRRVSKQKDENGVIKDVISKNDYIFKMGQEQIDYVRDLLHKVDINVGLSDSEDRTLKSLAGYSMSADGKRVIAKHRNFSNNIKVNKDNTELMSLIQNGFAALKSDAENLVAYNDARRIIQDEFQTMSDNNELAIGHNIHGFDLEAARKHYGVKSKLNALDTLELAKSNLRYGHRNKITGKRLFSYDLGSLADYYGIDRSQLPQDITQHTAEYDVAMNQAVAEKLYEDIQSVQKEMETEKVTVRKGQIGTAMNTKIRKSQHDFKLDSGGAVIGKEHGGDILFTKGHKYSFDGLIEKEINGIVEKFASYTDIETGQRSFSQLRTKTGHIDEFVNTFGNSFKSGDSEIGVEDALLSMFKETSGAYNLKTITSGNFGGSSTQANRHKLISSAKGELAGSMGLLEYMQKYLNDNASDIMGTQGVSNYLVSAIGSKMGVSQSERFDIRALKQAMGVENVHRPEVLKRRVRDFLDERLGLGHISKKFYNQATKEILDGTLDFSDEEFANGHAGSKIHGFTNWIYENLNSKYIQSQSKNSSLGEFSKYVQEYNKNNRDMSGLNSMMDEAISTYRKHYINTGKEVGYLYENTNDVFRNILTGQDTLNRLNKMGANTSEIGSNLGIYNEGDLLDGQKFDEKSLGGILVAFRHKLNGPGLQDIGHKIELTKDGKSLRIGVYSNDNLSRVINKDGTTNWNEVSGYLDIGLGENDLLSINGMDFMNYLMPYFDKSHKIKMGTAREFIAEETLGAMLNPKNLERIREGESIQGSINWYRDRILDQASSGGTYKSFSSSSFKREALDGIKAGATPEQLAVRSSAMGLTRLLTTAAHNANMDLGEGFTRTENLQDLMMYTAALSRGLENPIVLEKMGFNDEKVFASMGGPLANAEHRKVFASQIYDFIKNVPFAIEGLKEQGFLSEIMNMIGSRNITPMSFWNSGSSRYTDQFFNYLDRTTGNEDKDLENREFGYSKGILKNFLSRQGVEEIMGEGFHKSDIYDQFITGYANDYDLNSLKEKAEGITDVGLKDKVLQTLKYFKGSFLEGGALISESTAKRMNAYRNKTLDIELNKLKKINPDFYKQKIQGMQEGDTLNLKGSGVVNDVFSAFGIDFKKGDIVQELIKTAKGVSVRYKEVAKAESGSKFITEHGNRQTIAGIFDDQVFSWIAEATGNKGAHIISEKQGLKLSNISEMLGGRLQYIMNSYINAEQKKGTSMEDIHSQIQERLSKAKPGVQSLFNKMFAATDYGYDTIGMNTAQGYKYIKDGELLDLFDKKIQEEDFFLKDGQDGFMYALGTALLGDDYNPNLVAGGAALSNIYKMAGPMGGGTEEDAFYDSKYKIGTREIDGIRAKINAARLGKNNKNAYSKVAEYMETIYSPKDSDVQQRQDAIIWRDSYEQAIADTTELNDINFRNESDLTKRLSGSVDKVYKLVSGKVDLTDDEINIDDLISGTMGSYTKGMTEKEFARTTQGQIIEAFKKKGVTDLSKVKVVASLGRSVNLHGGTGLSTVSEIAMPLGVTDVEGRKNIMYTETMKQWNGLFRAMRESSAGHDKDGKILESAANDVMANLFSARDKNSSVFQELYSARTANSMAGSLKNTSLTDTTQGDDNTAFITTNDMRALLSNMDVSDLQAMMYGRFGKDLGDGLTSEEYVNEIIKEVMNGGSLLNVSHRFPSIDREPMWFSKLKIDDSIGDGNIRVGHGMIKGWNGDQDGDKGYVWTPFGNLGKHMSTDAGKDYIKNLFQEAEELEQRDSRIADLLGGLTRTNEQPDVDNRTDEEKDAEKLAKDKAVFAQATGAEGAIVDILSKRQFGNIGKLNTLGTKFRNATKLHVKNNPLKFDPSKFDVGKYASTNIFSTLLEMTEQNSISAKKIGQKLINNDGSLDRSSLIAGLNNYISSIYNTKGYRYGLNSYDDNMAKADSIISAGREIGLLSDDNNAIMSGRQTEMMIARLQDMIAQQRGVDITDQLVIDELQNTYGVTGIRKDKSGKYYGGAISYGGLKKAIANTISDFGGIHEFSKALNSEESKYNTFTVNSENVGKTFESLYGKEYTDAMKAIDPDYGKSETPDSQAMETLTVGTINAGSIITGGNISTGGTSGSATGGVGGSVKSTSGSGLGGTNVNKNEPWYVKSTKFDPNDINSIMDAKNQSENILRKMGKTLLTEQDVVLGNFDVSSTTLTKEGHTYDGEYLVTASQLSKYLDSNKIATVDPSRQKVMTDIQNILEHGQATISYVKNGVTQESTIHSADELYKLTGNENIASVISQMRSTEMGTLVHTMMEKGYASIGAGEIAKDEEFIKQFNNLKRLGMDENSIRVKSANNVSALSSFYNTLFSSEIEKSKEEGKSFDFRNILKDGIQESSNIVQYGGKDGLTIAGTFDAAYRNYLVDYKNESTVNPMAHALQLEVLKDMLVAQYGSKEISYKDDEGKEIKGTISQLAQTSQGVSAIKKMIFGTGTNGTFESQALLFNEMSPSQKAELLNMVYANASFGKVFGLENVANPSVIDGVYRTFDNPLSSVANQNMYTKFREAKLNAETFEEFSTMMTNAEGDESKFIRHNSPKILKNGDTEYTYSYFDDYTRKQMEVKAIRTADGKVRVDDMTPTEKDMSSEYDTLVKDYQKILANKSFAEASLASVENELRDAEQEAGGELNGDRTEEQNQRINSLKEQKQQFERAVAQFKYDEALFLEKAPAGMIDTSSQNDEFATGIKAFWENTESSEAADIKSHFKNLRNKYGLLQQAEQQYSMHKAQKVDQSILDKDIQQAQRYRDEIEEIIKRIDELRAKGVDEGSMKAQESSSVKTMIDNFQSSQDDLIKNNRAFFTDPAATEAYQKRYLEGLKRMGELEKDAAILEEKRRKVNTSDERTIIDSHIASIREEQNQIATGMIYKDGVLHVAQRDAQGNFVTDDNGIVYDKYKVHTDNGNKVGFESDIMSQNQKNQRAMLDYQRQQTKPGIWGTLKGSVKSAASYMFGMSLGYTIIGMIRGQIQKLIQQIGTLDKTMTDLSIVTGKNRSEVTKLMQSYNGLAKQLGITTAEVSASANEWLRMGYSADEVGTLVKNSTMLAKLGMIDIGDATQYMTSAIKGYGVAVNDSMKIVDMATSLDMKYAVSAGYILEAMARTATGAKLAKVEMEDLQAMIAIVGETSQKDASVVGESFKTAFARFGNVKANAFSGNRDIVSLADEYSYESDVEEGNVDDTVNVNDIEKVLKQVGVEIRNGDEWKSYSDILDIVGKNFQKLSDYEKNAITTAMFGTRQRENGLIVLENYNKVLEARKIAEESAGTSIAKYIKYQDSMEAATNEVTNAYEKMVLSIQGSGAIKDVLHVFAVGLENIKLVLTGIIALTTILNLDKIISGISALTVMGNRMSISSIWSTLALGKKDNAFSKMIDSGIDKSYDRLKNNGMANIFREKDEVVFKGYKDGKYKKTGPQSYADMVKKTPDNIMDPNDYYKENKADVDKNVAERQGILDKNTRTNSFRQHLENYAKEHGIDISGSENLSEIKRDRFIASKIGKEGMEEVRNAYKNDTPGIIERFKNSERGKAEIAAKKEIAKKASEVAKTARDNVVLDDKDLKEIDKKINNAVSENADVKKANEELEKKKRAPVGKSDKSKRAHNKAVEKAEQEKNDIEQRVREEETQKTREAYLKEKQDKVTRKARREYLSDAGYDKGVIAEAQKATADITANNKKIMQDVLNEMGIKKGDKMTSEQRADFQRRLRAKSGYNENAFKNELNRRWIEAERRDISSGHVTKESLEELEKKRTVKASSITSASSIVGMIGGAQLGSEMASGFAEIIGQDEETWGAVGSMIGMYLLPQAANGLGSILGKTMGLGNVGQAGMGLALNAAMTIGMTLWNSYKKSVEKAEKKQAEKAEKSQEKIEKYSASENQTKFERYDKLAKDVNQYGDNISLTDSEYDEFISLGNELGQEFDNLVIGTDRFGNSLIGADGALGGLSKASEELLKIEKERLYKAKLEDPEKGDSLITKAFENYKEKVEDINKQFIGTNSQYSVNTFSKYGYYNMHSGEFIKAKDLGDTALSQTGIIDNMSLYSSSNKKETYKNQLENELDLIKEKYGEGYDWSINVDESGFSKVQYILPDAVDVDSDVATNYKKEIDSIISRISEQGIVEFNKEIKKVQEEFTKEFLPAILNLNPIYDSLGETTKSFISQIASGIDIEAAGIVSGDDYKKYIENNILSGIDTTKVALYEEKIKAFTEKEHKGVELTLSESSTEYQETLNLVKDLYNNAGKGSEFFKNTAKNAGYTQEKEEIEYNGETKERWVWTDKNNNKYVYDDEQWVSADGSDKVMDDDIYFKIMGGSNQAEDISNEILKKIYGESNINSKQAQETKKALDNLTIEEAQWVSEHNDSWFANRNTDDIIEAAHTEQLTSMSTTKSRIDDELDEKGLHNEFEKLIQSGKTFEEIKTSLGEKVDEDFYKQLGLLNDRAEMLGISLKEAYNQAENLSSIDKFGMTTKTISTIMTESENMMNIAMGANQGNLSPELMTYLQENAPELLAYTGSDLAAEIMKRQGMTTMLGASLKGTLSNSNDYFDKIYRESGITTSSAWSNKENKYFTSDDFNESIKNNRAMLEFQDYFSEALEKDESGNSYYVPSKIEKIANENEKAKKWLEDHNIIGQGDWEGHKFVQASAYGGTILSISDKIEQEMKKDIEEHIKSVSDFNVNQANRAFKELTKTIRDLNKQLEDLEKQNAINKLNTELLKLTKNIEGFDKKINLFDWGLDYLASGDFSGRSQMLEDNLSSLIDKNRELSDAMAEVENKTPQSAEEAEALKQKYDELSSSYVENQKAILNIEKQMQSLGVTMLSSAIDESFDALNKQMKATSDYASISNLKTYTGGATGLLNYNLAGTLESKNEVDKKRDQFKTLIKMQEDFNKKSLELNEQFLKMKEKQDNEDYARQKSDIYESKRDARVEYFQQYGHILMDRIGGDYEDAKKTAMEMIGVSEQDFIDYYKSSLGLSYMSDNEISQMANDIFDNNQKPPEGPSEKEPEEEPSDKTPKGDKEPKAKTPTIEGTDAKVDTPESVSTHITETMKAGIEDANLEMAENSKDYGIKAPPLNDSSWGMTINSGLGLKFRNAYLVIMKALNEYIENPDNQDAKLSAPALRWKDPRGWENNLVKRMKTKTDEAIEKVNEYLTNGESIKLQAPKIDEETWVKLGRLMAGCISAGINESFDGFSGNLQENIMNEADLSKKSDVGFINPVQVERAKITSKYGKRKSTTTKNGKQSSSYHQAIDIGGGINGVEIYAVADGEIIFSGEKGGYGNCVQILHDNGYITQYAHMQKASPYKVGQRIKQGDVVGYVGETGNSTGPHLDFKVQKNGKWVNPEKYIPGYASGTDYHKGGLALIGDEGLVNNKSGLFPELVILPNGEIVLVGTNGPVLTNLPKGTEVLNNSDTNDILDVNSYASGTGIDDLEIKDLTVTGDLTVEGNENVSGDLNTGDEKYKSVIDESKVSEFEEDFENMLDDITGTRDFTNRMLRDQFLSNQYKIPVLSEYERLENQVKDPTTRSSYKLLRELYSRKDEISDYKQLSNHAKQKYDEALINLEKSINEGASVEVIQARSNVVDNLKNQWMEYEKAIEESLNNSMQAFQNFADQIDNTYNNIKENLDADYENGWLGEKTSGNYYDPLRKAADERVTNIEKTYNGALQDAINKYVELGDDVATATAKAMNEDVVKALNKSWKNSIRERTQIDIDENNERIAKSERANQKIEEQLGYNNNLLDSQFTSVYRDTLSNTRNMINEDLRFLNNTENLSPEDQKATIDRLNQNTKALIDGSLTYVDNILNSSKKLTDASVSEREKQLSAGGITTYDSRGRSIFEKNIEDYKKEGESIAQAIVDTRYILEQEAIRTGLTDIEDIEEYINNNEKMISLNEQNLDNLKKQSEEHRKILDYTLEQINNEKKLLDLSKEDEWANKANIENYYDAVDKSLDDQIEAQKKYLESKNLSEEEYQKTKMAIAELEREKHNNSLQRMKDTQAFYEKEYSAMSYMINEYVDALNEEKETISKKYDEEIDKLQQVNNAKERSIKLTELQNALENAQNEKKRVYRAGVGFVYEQDRDAVKKAKDELDAFYKQDQIDNLNKAKEMESKILDVRIDKWNKYLDAMEKVYKTAERNHNINILENLLGVEGWHGVFDELNSDMSDFNINYEDGNKIYYGKWTGFLEKYTDLSEKIYKKLEKSVELLQDIKEFEKSDTTPENKNRSVEDINAPYKGDDISRSEYKDNSKSWKDERWRNKIRDFSSLYKDNPALAEELDITQQEAIAMHNEKESELLDFVRKYGIDNIFEIIRGKKDNDTEYTLTELEDAFKIGVDNGVSLETLTYEEADTRLDYINNLEKVKKVDVIEELLNDTVDIASMIKGIADGSTVNLKGVRFTKEELEEIRAEKIWMNYRSGKYHQYDDNGKYDHYKTLEYVAQLADDIDGADDKNDIGAFGTGLLGKFWDSLLGYQFNGTSIDEVSQTIHDLVEGQSKALDETNTTLFEVNKQNQEKVEFESTNTGGPQTAPNFNLYNYYIAKESNKLGQLMDTSAQVQDITNKK